MEPSEANVLVCITCRNYEQYLDSARLSVDSQTHTCSTAVFHDRCDKDDPVGVATTRNRLFSFEHLKTFDYIIFLDADDILPSNYVEELLRESRSEKVIVTCGMETFGDIIGKANVQTPINLETLLELNTVHISALIPVDIFKESGGFNTDFDAFEDWEYWCRLAFLGYEFRNCTSTRLQRRVHFDSRHSQKPHDVHFYREKLQKFYSLPKLPEELTPTKFRRYGSAGNIVQ